MIKLEETEIYQLAMRLGEETWALVVQWPDFPRRKLGLQFTSSADSVAANFAEGYGRFFYKDRRTFCYYSRGSLLETKVWLTKAQNRGLVHVEKFNELCDLIALLHHKLNAYIAGLNREI